MKSRGFTLVELVMVIVVMGIIAATLTVFFRPAIDSYLDAKRRANLSDMADTALRRMSREVRSSVSNSLRTASNQCFEFLPTSTGGRFRMATDAAWDAAHPGALSAAIDGTQKVTAFDVLSPLSITPASSDWVVIDNQNTNDVYGDQSGSIVYRAQIASVSAAPASLGNSRISLLPAGVGVAFSPSYDGGRFVVVANNGGKPVVSYVCSGADGSLDADGNGKGTLYRVTTAFSAAYPGACQATAGGAILATHVASCNFVYDPNHGATQQSGFLWMQLVLTEANESAALSYGVHVDNVP